MAKTKEELNEIRKSVKELSAVLQELTEDELNEVFGGVELGNWGNESAVGCNELGSESCAPDYVRNIMKKLGESFAD